MKANRAFTAAALSLLPLGQPLLLGTLGITTATTAVLLQAPPALAQDSPAVARIINFFILHKECSFILLE